MSLPNAVVTRRPSAVAGDGFLTLAVGGAVLVAIGHGLVVDGQDAVVGDGDAEGLAGEIV